MKCTGSSDDPLKDHLMGAVNSVKSTDGPYHLLRKVLQGTKTIKNFHPVRNSLEV